MTESLLAAAAGAALGGAAGGIVGLALPGAVVGGLNGALAGHRRIHDWRSPKSVGWFVIDSTWALTTTGAALIVHVVANVRSAPGYAVDLSERRDRHVYARGFRIRRGFAVTVGNVVSGVGDPTDPRRARLVDDHEEVHVRQARLFGPAFPLLYGGWMIGGSVVGAVMWIVRHRGERFGRVVETYAYYLNPFEWWAYSRDSAWPPAGKVPGIGWRRPAIRGFAQEAAISPAGARADRRGRHRRVKSP
ncbi:MAG: hypothetical protein ACO4CU_07820 [Ilumatobacteraceae bacterium]